MVRDITSEAASCPEMDFLGKDWSLLSPSNDTTVARPLNALLISWQPYNRYATQVPLGACSTKHMLRRPDFPTCRPKPFNLFTKRNKGRSMLKDARPQAGTMSPHLVFPPHSHQ